MNRFGLFLAVYRLLNKVILTTLDVYVEDNPVERVIFSRTENVFEAAQVVVNDNNKYFSVETPNSTSPIPVSHLNINASIEAREPLLDLMYYQPSSAAYFMVYESLA